MSALEPCNHWAGSDPCNGALGHDGDHWTYWGKASDKVRPVMYWRGNEDWARPQGGAA